MMKNIKTYILFKFLYNNPSFGFPFIANTYCYLKKITVLIETFSSNSMSS